LLYSSDFSLNCEKMGEAINVIGLENTVVVVAHFENNLRIVQYFIITGCLIHFY